MNIFSVNILVASVKKSMQQLYFFQIYHMNSTWYIRLGFLCLFLLLYLMVTALLTVTEIDQKREMSLNQGMEGRQIHRGLSGVIDVNKRRKKPTLKISWCKRLAVRSPPGPITALASYPGSGNTWSRYIIQ